MYTKPLAVYMAKLYWRIKKNGKWTWKAANCEHHGNVVGCIHCEISKEED